MASIFITYKLPGAVREALEAAGHTVTMREDEALISHEELVASLTKYDGIITLLTDRLNKDDLAQAGPQLKVLANYAVGYDNIDVPAATERGIVVTNTPAVLNEAVAEHAVALLISVARRIVESDQFTRAGKYHGWRPELLLGTELHNKTLGVIGLGRIGVEVAKRAQRGFGMKIIYYDIKPNPDFEKEYNAVFYATLEELLPLADAISLHVPLLPTTTHLINKERLALMKPTALLINTSRGPVVDEAALVEALQTHVIRGAGLDVFEKEPALAPGLADLPNVILTPHTASATVETRTAMAELAAKNVIAVLAGEAAVTPVTS